MKFLRSVVNIHQKKIIKKKILDKAVLVKTLLVRYDQILDLEGCKFYLPYKYPHHLHGLPGRIPTDNHHRP